MLLRTLGGEPGPSTASWALDALASSVFSRTIEDDEPVAVTTRASKNQTKRPKAAPKGRKRKRHGLGAAPRLGAVILRRRDGLRVLEQQRRLALGAHSLADTMYIGAMSYSVDFSKDL